MVIPLVSREKIIGLLNLETTKASRFTEDSFQFLQILANRISVALDNTRLYQDAQTHLQEVQQLYDQVSRLEKLKTDMIRIAAHDLRNPLGIISGYLQMIEMEKDQLDESIVNYISPMMESTDRMTSILHEILSLERIEQMAAEEFQTKFSLREYVEKAYHEFKGQAEGRSLELAFVVDDKDHDFAVIGDPSQIYEAMTNLLSNAVKYTPETGKVDILLSCDSDNAIFKVTDTGFGIPAEQQEKLFQPFFRAEVSEVEGIEGTGLGLHLVKSIIDRHKGELIFSSEYGKGSIFGFSLPRSL